MNLEKFFEEIKIGLSSSHKVFKTTSLSDEEGQLRSVEEANIILDAIQYISKRAHDLVEEYPSLETVFEKDYGPIKDLQERESVIEICFLDDYLFPEVQACPFPADSIVNEELTGNYALSFKDWCAEKIDLHLKSQEIIKEKFDIELKPSDLGCPCNKCTADFRAKIRDSVFKEQIAMIDKSEEELHELVLMQKVSYISDYVQKLRKRLDRNSHRVRYKLKRGSINKLDSDVKSYFKKAASLIS